MRPGKHQGLCTQISLSTIAISNHFVSDVTVRYQFTSNSKKSGPVSLLSEKRKVVVVDRARDNQHPNTDAWRTALVPRTGQAAISCEVARTVDS